MFRVLAYGWILGPLVLTGVMLAGYAAVQAVRGEQERRRSQDLEPLPWLLLFDLAVGAAILAAVGFLLFLS